MPRHPHLRLSVRVLSTVLSVLLAMTMSAQSGRPSSLKDLIANYPELASTLQSSSIDDLTLIDNYVSRHNQIHHYYFQKQVSGIPVDNGYLHVHISEIDRKVIATHARHLDIAQKSIDASPTTSASQAALIAMADVNIEEVTIDEVIADSQSTNETQAFKIAAPTIESAKAQLSYIVTAEKTLRLQWLIDIETIQPAYHLWRIYVDAATGEVTKKYDLVLSCNFDHVGDHKSHTADHRACSHNHEVLHPASISPPIMGQSYRVYDIPVESPNHGSRILVSNPADSLASPYGWHDDNGIAGVEYTITRGNNVLAQDDINGNNGSGYSPDGGAGLEFDYTLDFTQAANSNTPQAENLNSSLTNLFYWNNKMHDLFYHYGFDEVSGNFQQNNYGRGGSGSDYVFADGLDGSGSNNANFGTPPDGSNPRMQMFLWGSVNSGTTTMTVNSPATTAGSYTAVAAGFGPLNYAVTGDLVIVNDGSADGSQGCNTLINGADISGNIALIDRGNCQFGTKSLNAQNAGAVAVIICNNDNTAPFTMGGGNDGGSVTIPAIMMSQSDCATIRVNVPGTNVTLTTSGATPRLDGSFDNGIIAHEYGHGISNRLTGGPSAASCLTNEEQMGEGWSDFFGLVMTHETGDTRNTSRGIGTYAIGSPVTGGGIRPFPYTTDMTVNPSTYGDVSNTSFSQPHGIGSIWCTMLWDLYWDLVDVYGYDPDIVNGTGGNNIAIQLVVDGLKLQPCSPGFADGRDAILLADQINNQGANKCLIWNAFARRGLGASASQGSSNNRSDGVEAFDLPTGIDLLPNSTNDIVEGQSMTITSTAVCDCTPKTNVAISSTVPSGLNITNTMVGAQNNSTISNSITSLDAGDSLQIIYTVEAPLCSTPVTGALLDDDVEGADQWTSVTLAVSGNWVTSTTIANSGTTSWYAAGPAISSDFALESNSSYTLTSSGIMTFKHRYQTETVWDGGVVEISTNGGASWQDLGPFMVENGYPSAFASNGSSNLAGRPAFTGNSATQFGTSDWVTTSIDLGFFGGETISVRFRYASDDNTNVGGLAGWYIDDIRIEAVTERQIPVEVTVDNSLLVSDMLIFDQIRPDRSIIYVDSSAIDGLKTGATWVDAFVDLQQALLAADCEAGPVEIWVARGTYYPSTTNDRTMTFLLRDSTSIYGGFSGSESILNERDVASNPSILSGAIGVASIDTDNSYRVVTAAGVNQTAILDGFVIQNGYADDNLGQGGGLLIEDSSPMINNCMISNNYADSTGGGIVLIEGSATISNSTIVGNSSGTNTAVGVFHSSGTLTLDNVTIDELSGTSLETTAPASLIVRGTTTISE